MSISITEMADSALQADLPVTYVFTSSKDAITARMRFYTVRAMDRRKNFKDLSMEYSKWDALTVTLKDNELTLTNGLTGLMMVKAETPASPKLPE